MSISAGDVRSEIPLHNNESESEGDIREYVKRRKISLCLI